MAEWLLRLEPWQQALVGTGFTYFMTALGAALVFFFKEIKKDVLNLMLGFASGVMIAASFWSLLDPAITKAEENGDIAWLVVSIGFGLATTADNPTTAVLAAVSVALGIGIQNFPEGAAVSIPLRQEGLSRTKAFMYGQASGIVEPIAGIVGAILVTKVSILLPYALAFAAGAMIYVVVEELIPEAQQTLSSKRHFAVFGVMLGFIIMMILDVALG